jgi:hypothetical protein
MAVSLELLSTRVRPVGPDIGLRVDFEHTGGTLRHSSGASRGGHGTPSPRPVRRHRRTIRVPGCYWQIRAVLRDIGTFIDGNEPVVRDQLRELSRNQPGN